MKRYSSLAFIALALLFFTHSSFAQMFSVGDSPREPQFSNSYLRIGVSPTSFAFTGNRLANPSSSSLELENNSIFIGFETPGVELNLMLSNGLTGLDEQALFDLSFILSNKFSLIRNRALQAGIPIHLYSSLTNVNNDANSESFNQANFAVGGGAFFSLRIAKKIVFAGEFTPGYGFSNSSGGFFGGSMYYMKGKSRVNFLNLIAGRSLSLGYDYNFRSFDIDDDFYDFDLTSHTITLGISF